MASSHRTDPPLPIDTSEQGRGIRSCRICDDALETAPHYLWGLIGRTFAIRENHHERLGASLPGGCIRPGRRGRIDVARIQPGQPRGGRLMEKSRRSKPNCGDRKIHSFKMFNQDWVQMARRTEPKSMAGWLQAAASGYAADRVGRSVLRIVRRLSNRRVETAGSTVWP
jgi:hypothetical protein